MSFEVGDEVWWLWEGVKVHGVIVLEAPVSWDRTYIVKANGSGPSGKGSPGGNWNVGKNVGTWKVGHHRLNHQNALVRLAREA